MKAWDEGSNASELVMLVNKNTNFVKSMGLDIDFRAVGMGRSLRMFCNDS